jgi:hypothetical protein
MSCNNNEPKARPGSQTIGRDLSRGVADARAARAAALAPVNFVTQARQWLIGLSGMVTKTPKPSSRQFRANTPGCRATTQEPGPSNAP